MRTLDEESEIPVSVASVATAGERGTCLEVLRLRHDLVDEGADLLHYDLNSVADGELSRWVRRAQRNDVGGIEGDVVADVAKHLARSELVVLRVAGLAFHAVDLAGDRQTLHHPLLAEVGAHPRPEGSKPVEGLGDREVHATPGFLECGYVVERRPSEDPRSRLVDRSATQRRADHYRQLG